MYGAWSGGWNPVLYAGSHRDRLSTSNEARFYFSQDGRSEEWERTAVLLRSHSTASIHLDQAVVLFRRYGTATGSSCSHYGGRTRDRARLGLPFRERRSDGRDLVQDRE